ncbi:MAG: hypothetical protein IPM56_04060 [Ignavibacteriales bacterium]|nr:MAG: hypothetical protein IPM56_04060 [Ignavibacteriales bacterium]
MTRDKNNIGKRQNTMTKTLINNIGLQEVETLWVQHGCYKAAEELSKMLNTYISFSTIRYLSQVCRWTRPVNPKSAIYIGVKRGTVPASDYPHLIFPEEETKNE